MAWNWLPFCSVQAVKLYHQLGVKHEPSGSDWTTGICDHSGLIPKFLKILTCYPFYLLAILPNPD